jgi:WD40 repeat protein
VWGVDCRSCVAVTTVNSPDTILGHEACVLCVDIGDCRSIVASCSEDTTARVWGPKDGAWSRSILMQHDTGVKSIALSADGSRALTGDEGGVVRVWNAATGMQCVSALRRHNTDTTALAVEYSKATSGYSETWQK